MDNKTKDLIIKLKTLLSVFELEENPKIDKAFEVMNDKESTKNEKTNAKETIIKLISKSMLGSEILKSGLTSEQFKAVRKELKKQPNLEKNNAFVTEVLYLYLLYIDAAREYSFVETSKVFDKVLKGNVNDTVDKLLEENWELYAGNNKNFERLFEIAILLHNELGNAIIKSKKKTALEQYKEIDEEYKLARQAMREDLNVIPVDACNALIRYVEMELEFYNQVKGIKKTDSKKKVSFKEKIVAFFQSKEKKKSSGKGKRIIAGVIAGIVVFGTAYFIGKSSGNKSASNNNQSSIGNTIDKPNNDVPVVIPPEDNSEKELLAKVNVLAENVYNNWKNIPGNEYTKNDITELIKCLNGLESTIDYSTADQMLIEIINKVIVPAVNNAMYNVDVFAISPVLLSDLLIDDIQAINDMEEYFNGAIINTSNKQLYTNYLNNALVDEHLILEGKTHKGINLDTAKPQVRLLWARLVTGTNAMLGTLGEDYVYIYNNTVYTAKEVDDYRIYDAIINGALKDLGVTSKTLIK